MNAPHPLSHKLPMSSQMPAPAAEKNDDAINIQEYWDIAVDSRWLIAAVIAGFLTIGAAYAFLAKPVYESNLLIQVEDSAGSAKSFLGDAASLFDVKTPASAEMEIIRSRMVVGQAVDATRLYIDASPNYLPVVGHWLARSAKKLSDPGLIGFGGWVTGAERIEIGAFDVPQQFEGSRFLLTLTKQGRYSVAHPDLAEPLEGSIGVPLSGSTPEGSIKLLVNTLEGKPGAQFEVVRNSRLETIETLQENLKLSEKGRQSGVIDVTLQESNRDKLTLILNEIGQQYVRQNVERKAAEAQKTLSFLDLQLPQFKKQLDHSEEAYNRYRNQHGTVALDEEAKLILSRSGDLQGKLVEAEQRRRELVSRFTAEHPAIRTLDDQIAAWKREISALNARVKGLPSVQQDALRLERDVKVNNELYQQLRNNALQLQLVREGKIGNVRLLDQAVSPEEPVKPRRGSALGIALLLGIVCGFGAALARNSMFRGIRSPQEVEAHVGLNVYSTIPVSHVQAELARKVAEKQPGTHLLAQVSPQDIAVESLRSLRTALQFAMLESPNNRVLITGATPGVGKSFVSANFAATVASANRRVLLIDADLRKGHLNQYFGLSRKHGLSELITGTIGLDQAIRRKLLPNLDFMPTGVLPPNPAELVMSANFMQLLEQVSQQYDLVLIDSAPVLAAADTLSVAPQVGTVLLVARAEETHVGELAETNKRLSHAGARVTGAILNAVDLTRRHYGSYGYKYGGYQLKNYSYGSEG